MTTPLRVEAMLADHWPCVAALYQAGSPLPAGGAHDAAEQAGVWTIQTGIFPENTASLALHQRVGFGVVGVRERLGQLDGTWPGCCPSRTAQPFG